MKKAIIKCFQNILLSQLMLVSLGYSLSPPIPLPEEYELYPSDVFQGMHKPKNVKRILITYFGPYFKIKDKDVLPVDINASKIVAEGLAQYFSGEEYQLDFCALDTEYFVSTQQAKDCLKAVNYNYDVVIGLGQYHKCNLKVEEYVYNKDNSKAPDNAGVVRRRKNQVRFGKRKLRLSFIPNSIFLNDADKELVVSSKDPGRYVCNHYGYGISRYLKETRTKFSFVHVGNAKCENHDELSRILSELIKYNL